MTKTGNSSDQIAASTASHKAGRSRLIIDLLVFQLKLGLDGARDLFLSPVAIFAALLGLIFAGDKPGKHFYALMRWGHKSDVWISLFSAYRESEATTHKLSRDDGFTSDTIITHIEQWLKERR